MHSQEANVPHSHVLVTEAETAYEVVDCFTQEQYDHRNQLQNDDSAWPTTDAEVLEKRTEPGHAVVVLSVVDSAASTVVIAIAGMHRIILQQRSIGSVRCAHGQAMCHPPQRSHPHQSTEQYKQAVFLQSLQCLAFRVL